MTRSRFRFAALALFFAVATTAPTAATTRTNSLFHRRHRHGAGERHRRPRQRQGQADVGSRLLARPAIACSAAPTVAGPRPVATTSGTTHTSYSLVNGTTYSFTVAAYTRGGNGPLSMLVSARRRWRRRKRVTAQSGDARVTLNWQPSAGATSYTVYRKFGSELVVLELATGVWRRRSLTPASPTARGTTTSCARSAGATQSELSAKVSRRCRCRRHRRRRRWSAPSPATPRSR